MTKSEFIDQIAERARVTREMAERVVEAIFDTASGAIAEAVHGSGSISIHGFGTFTKQRRAARRVRHPRSGAVVEIPEHAAITFRAGRGTRRPAVRRPRRNPARGRPGANAVSPPQNPTLRELAEFVWETPEKADRWLHSPHLMLDGHTPLEAAETAEGVERVKEILWRMEYSIYA